jgi:hypothetical protein
LWARFTVTGPWLYFAYKHRGKVKLRALEPYDPDGRRGLTLAQARDWVAELARVYRTGDTDIHGHVRHDTATKVAAREAADEAAARELQLAQQGSLRALLDAYADHLEARGKVSARDLRLTFKHVPPELQERRASQLGMGDFLPPINVLVEAGKGRMAGKLRACLRAEYALALSSQTDPAAPQSRQSARAPCASSTGRGIGRCRIPSLRATFAPSRASRAGAVPKLSLYRPARSTVGWRHGLERRNAPDFQLAAAPMPQAHLRQHHVALAEHHEAMQRIVIYVALALRAPARNSVAIRDVIAHSA